MNTKTEEPSTIWVCVDCYLAHEGYDEHELGREFEREPMNLIPDGVDVTAGLLWEEHAYDCENRAHETWVTECDCERIEFSKSSCDGCGSTLAGEREALTAWYPKED